MTMLASHPGRDSGVYTATPQSLVSVYLPTKNRASLMERAVLSVLNQTHRNLELLVIDDGSTDNTASVLQRIAGQDERVRVFRNEVSKGAPYSRNIGISAATGVWITGIDDDDLFSPERIEALLAYWNILEDAKVEFSCIYTQDMYDDGQRTTYSRKRGDVSWMDLLEYNTVGSQVFTLVERVRGCGMFDIGMPAWQDLDLFMRIIKTYGRAKLLDAPLYTVSIEDRSDRISKSKKERIVEAFDRIASKHPEVLGQLRQKLFLQIFGDLYKHKPSLRDVFRFLSFGWDHRNARRLFSLLLKQR